MLAEWICQGSAPCGLNSMQLFIFRWDSVVVEFIHVTQERKNPISVGWFQTSANYKCSSCYSFLLFHKNVTKVLPKDCLLTNKDPTEVSYIILLDLEFVRMYSCVFSCMWNLCLILGFKRSPHSIARLSSMAQHGTYRSPRGSETRWGGINEVNISVHLFSYCLVVGVY